jgi:hypothetical protein
MIMMTRNRATPRLCFAKKEKTMKTCARILINNGFEKVEVYPGGVSFYAVMNRK